MTDKIKARIVGPNKFEKTQVYQLEIQGFPIDNCMIEWYLDDNNDKFEVDIDMDLPFRSSEATVIGYETGKGKLRAKISYYDSYTNDEGEDEYSLIGIKKIFKTIDCITADDFVDEGEEEEDDNNRDISPRSSSSENSKAFDERIAYSRTQYSLYRHTNNYRDERDVIANTTCYASMQSAYEATGYSSYVARRKISRNTNLRTFHRRVLKVMRNLNRYIGVSYNQKINSSIPSYKRRGAKLAGIYYTTTGSTFQWWPKNYTGYKEFGRTGFIGDRFVLKFSLNSIERSSGRKLDSTIAHELIHALGLQASQLYNREDQAI